MIRAVAPHATLAEVKCHRSHQLQLVGGEVQAVDTLVAGIDTVAPGGHGDPDFAAFAQDFTLLVVQRFGVSLRCTAGEVMVRPADLRAAARLRVVTQISLIAGQHIRIRKIYFEVNVITAPIGERGLAVLYEPHVEVARTSARVDSAHR